MKKRRHFTYHCLTHLLSSLPLQVIAVYDYVAQGDQELSLEEGDIVTLVAREDEVWWCGQLKGRMGMFPANYVEPYDDQDSTAV